ncbi:hypothetical protein DFJ77DRAFT_506175 [Powellomyces hirtus]|nr:hypothetical protein DFJ77DRAFT_506175 [Powellomyces hirtus]
MQEPFTKVVLVTGANSGVGYGIMQRLIEHSLGARAEATTVLVMGCRSRARAEAARGKLLGEARKTAKRDVPESMIQILLVDLSDTENVFKACAEFKKRFTRLDALHLNAGILPCTAMDIPTGIRNLITRPSYVAQTGGDFFKQEIGVTTAEGLSAVFAANVFGHYIMTKELLSHMTPGARVLWFSSTTASTPAFFDATDYQCLKGDHPYESSKRLCEILAVQLNHELREKNVNVFVVSPGNCYTGLMGQGAVIDMCIVVVLHLMRLLYISGCNVSPRNGATAPIYLTNEVTDASSLSPDVLYHSEISPLGSRSVKRLPLSSLENPKTPVHLLQQVEDLYLSFREKAVHNGIISA